MRTPLAFALSASIALTFAASASADEDAATRAANKATARALGQEGMKAYDSGDFATAVDKLNKAHQLVQVPTLAFYAGKSLEKLGRIVEAEEKYHDAMNDPIEPGAPAAVKAAVVDAGKARTALLPRIPSVVITIQPPLPDAQVTLDGKVIPPAALGVKRLVDPGSHSVQVQRYGGVTSRQFSLHEGESTSVTLDVPAAGAIPMPPGYGPPVGAPGYGPPPGTQVYYVPGEAPAPMKRKNMGLFVAGCVIAPLGAVLALAGGVAVAVESDTNTVTFGGNGSTVGGGSSTAPGYALVVVGLLGMGGGIAMAVIGGKKVPVETTAPPPPPRVSFEPLLGPGSAGLRVRF